MQANIPSELAVEVANTQVRLLYRNALTGALVSASVSILLVWLQAQGPLSDAALPWLITMLAISTGRVILALAYTRNSRLPGETAFWRNAFMVGVGLAGAGWMATIFIFMPVGDPVQQFATALVLAGMAAGAVPILSAVLNAYYLFISLTLIPAAIYFFLAGDVTSIIIGLLTLIMMMGLLQGARFLNQTLLETLILSAERARLATKLETANAEIEQHNAKLQTDHVLVVDDNAVNQEVVQSILESAGYKVNVAADGEMALAKMAAIKIQGAYFDAILMDLHMPVMDG